MGKQQFQCQVCGTLISSEHARREHCQSHHPAVSSAKLDIFFPMEFKKISDDVFNQIGVSTSIIRHSNASEISPIKAISTEKFVDDEKTDKDIRDALSSEENIFITGKAGTGKTTLLKKIVNSINEQGKLVAVLAPTGVAAKNADGVTIHSFLKLPISPYLPNVKINNLYNLNIDGITTVKHVDTIIIDEISMVRCDLLDMVDNVLRYYRKSNNVFGGVRIIAFGDLYQLMPVVTSKDWTLLKEWYRSPYFFSSKTYERHPFKMITLKHVYRQTDVNFLDLLNEVRNGSVSDDNLSLLEKKYQECKNVEQKKGVIRLTTHNRLSNDYNELIFKRLSGYTHEYIAKISGYVHKVEHPTAHNLSIKKGARVMFIKNDSSPSHSYVNGSLGTVTNCDTESVTVKLDDNDSILKVGPQTWYFDEYFYNRNTHTLELRHRGTFRQIPLKLAWAITIHKSQGLTFDNVIIDAGKAFTYGQVYVALSRCRNFDGITLATPITADIIKTDPIVKHFMNPDKKYEDLPAFTINKSIARTAKRPNNLHGLNLVKWLAEHDYSVEDICIEFGYDNSSLVYSDLCKLISKGKLGLACRLSIAKINDIKKAWQTVGLSADMYDVKQLCQTDVNFGEIGMVKCYIEYLNSKQQSLFL